MTGHAGRLPVAEPLQTEPAVLPEHGVCPLFFHREEDLLSCQ